MPRQFILQALDDDGDGVEDPGAFDVLCAHACSDVDSLLSPLFTVPFADPFPVLVNQAAHTFAAALLYQRRGMTSDKNPFAKDAVAIAEKLTRLVQKKEPVPKDFPVSVATVSASTERCKSVSTGGFLQA